jgi:hypothetical protein
MALADYSAADMFHGQPRRNVGHAAMAGIRAGRVDIFLDSPMRKMPHCSVRLVTTEAVGS